MRERAGITTLSAAIALAPLGCAIESTTRPSLAEPGVMAMLEPGSSDLEREGRQRRIESEADPKGDRLHELSKPLVWTGVGVGAVGAAAALGFGVAGYVTTNQIEDGYLEDGLSKTELDRLSSRGEAFNAIATTGLVLGVLGLGMAAIVYGMDATRCGPFHQKKRGCTPK